MLYDDKYTSWPDRFLYVLVSVIYLVYDTHLLHEVSTHYTHILSSWTLRHLNLIEQLVYTLR